MPGLIITEALARPLALKQDFQECSFRRAPNHKGLAAVAVTSLDICCQVCLPGSWIRPSGPSLEVFGRGSGKIHHGNSPRIRIQDDNDLPIVHIRYSEAGVLVFGILH